MSLNPGPLSEIEHSNEATYPLPKELPLTTDAGLVLMRVMHDAYSYDASVRDNANHLATNYFILPNSSKIVNYEQLNLEQFQTLSENFRNNPRVASLAALSNLHDIAADSRQDEADATSRLDRYLERYYAMIMKMDSRKYTPDFIKILNNDRQKITQRIWNARQNPFEDIEYLADQLI